MSNLFLDTQEWFARYYKISGITIKVSSELPFCDNTFNEALKEFECECGGDDTIDIKHYFRLPEIISREGELQFANSPWEIYKTDGGWTYICILPDGNITQYIELSRDYSTTKVYSMDASLWENGNNHSLWLISTDQIIIASLLSQRRGFYIHSAGMILDGNGFLFVGYSGAGKTTMTRLLESHAEILCDDRNIVRLLNGEWYVYGTWSHGESNKVSRKKALLKGLFLLNKSQTNYIESLADRSEIARKLLPLIIRPLTTKEWWDDTFSIAEQLIEKVPVYNIYFNRSLEIVELIRECEG